MESKTGMMLAAVAAVLACRVSAEEIAFTGGSDGTGTDLALASNWAVGKTPARIMLMAVDPAVVDATFALDGLSRASTLSFDRASGLLQITTAKGAVIIFR